MSSVFPVYFIKKTVYNGVDPVINKIPLVQVVFFATTSTSAFWVGGGEGCGGEGCGGEGCGAEG